MAYSQNKGLYQRGIQLGSRLKMISLLIGKVTVKEKGGLNKFVFVSVCVISKSSYMLFKIT